MEPMKFSCGIWAFSPCIDRFCTRGYREKLSLNKMIESASKVEDLSGVEMHYPSDFTLADIENVKDTIKQYNLKVAGIAIDLFSDSQWQMGALSIADENKRRKAIKIAKEAIDAAENLDADLNVMWLGQDGYDYPFQVNYEKCWNRLINAIQEVADYKPHRKIALEYKLKEPRTHIFISTVGKALWVVQQVNRDNVGVLIDIGHSYMAFENPAEAVYLLASSKKLYHTHFNDNYRDWDHDMIVGSVHLWELMEFLFWLKKVDYKGWYSLDIYPSREDPIKAATESIKQIKFALKALDKIGYNKMLNILESNNPIKLIETLRDIT